MNAATPESLVFATGALAAVSLGLPLIASAWAWQARRIGLLGLPLAILGLLATLGLFLDAVPEMDGPAVRVGLGGWEAPLGVTLHLDGLALAMMLLNALVALAGSLYARGYIRSTAGERQFWPLWLWLWGGLNLLVLSGDAFNLYITLEIASISAVALVALTGDTDAVTGAMRYLLINLLGSLSFLLGAALLYGKFGVLDLTLLGELAGDGPTERMAAVLMLGGLLMKAAVFPLHVWLATAHASAPAPVSGMLSGMVVAAMFYLILRLWLLIFAPLGTPALAVLLGLLGSAALLWGSLQALRAPRLKIVAAYSTVAQMGYIALAFPILILQPAAWPVVVFFAFAHGLAKAAVLMGAGTLQKAAGHDRMNALGPVLRARGRTVFALGLGGISLMGLPLTGGFLAKYLLLEAGLHGAAETTAIMQIWTSLWLVMVALGSLLATAYILRMVAPAFARGERDPGVPVSAGMEWMPLALAVGAAAMGLAGAPLLHLLGHTAGVS
ncbi:complex I subunit 5 family protein [Thioalkalivibrio sp. ALE23]|uniref:complex I subunit 5 family protein n=1 Tax=Thioalkalivibrio sp. ALE23 TaxID=1265495 RepID=UPI000367AABB|nr:proton-conducting transporter membrane subunit [Thioalkalivibrio sp. ALE23]